MSEKPKNPKDVLFIHGMFMNSNCWRGWQTFYQERGYTTDAPDWPFHEGDPEAIRSMRTYQGLATLELSAVLAHYRTILRRKPTKPILIGHSMGGLVAQVLLSEGFGQAAIAMHSAPPQGVFAATVPFLRATWALLRYFDGLDQPLRLEPKEFAYAICNLQTPEAQRKIYQDYFIPESRVISRGPLSKDASIDYKRARGPLLLMAGDGDHLIPSKLNAKNFKRYAKTPAVTDYLLMKDRDHSTILSAGWQDVAQSTLNWLEHRLERA